MTEDADAAPAYRRNLVQMEAERAAVLQEQASADQESQQAQIVALWTPADVARLLNTLRESLEADLADDHVRPLRDSLNLLIEQVITLGKPPALPG